jgi:L-aminopeptidase/D-esterase-like protein
MHDDITDVPGVRVGHDTDLAAQTGCTVILCDAQPTVGGVDVRGGAPGTRETDLLSPTCTIDEVHAVLLTGGSAFGLDAATGVLRALERAGIGYDTGVARVPIVPAAVLFDLAVGRADVRPDAASGERAVAAATAGPIAQGRVGAGTGATTGKIGGPATIRPGGLGSASATLPDGTIVGTLVAVNALGHVIDPADPAPTAVSPATTPLPGMNTTLAVIATSARLDKAQATKIAQMAHDGLARVINPLHTPFDGDVVFALALSAPGASSATAADILAIGATAADTLARAVLKARQAAAQ